VTSFLQYLLHTFENTGIQLLILVVPLLILAFAMNFVSLITQRWAVGLLGYRAWLIIFKAVGTPIHELGHAIFCILFGHRIEKISLFNPAPDGTLGYVEHCYNRRNIYHQVGNFFIGMGPVIFGCVVITLAALLLVGGQVFTPIQPFANGLSLAPFNLGSFLNSLGTTLTAIFKGIFQPSNFQHWQFYIFLYLVFAIGNSITLSPSDLYSAGLGFLFFVLFLLVLNGITGWMGDFLIKGTMGLNPILIQFEILMLVALFLNILVAIVILVLLLFKRLLLVVFSR
jgi:hypothetical protein